MTHKENYLVAFLDILGFKSLINDCIEKDDESILENLKTGLKNAESNMDRHKEAAKETSYDLGLKMKQFSDCTSLSFKHPSIQLFEENNKLLPYELAISLLVIRDFQRELLESFIYTRGGLSWGRVHYENENMIFSEALINSYKLESEKAIYPRVILHENLFYILKIMFENNADSMARLGVNKILIHDLNGIVFINPFNLCEVYECEIPRVIKKNSNLSKSQMDKMIEELKQKDSDFQSKVLEDVREKINEEESKADIDCNKLKKFYWLKEFIEWNRDDKPSKFKFEYLKYEHLG